MIHRISFQRAPGIPGAVCLLCAWFMIACGEFPGRAEVEMTLKDRADLRWSIESRVDPMTDDELARMRDEIARHNPASAR